MVEVLGNKGCSRCMMVKTLLTNKKIKFEYHLLEDLSKEKQEKYTQMAEELGMMTMPLIIKDGVLVDLKEVM